MKELQTKVCNSFFISARVGLLTQRHYW
jgi:hypothetical protein